MRGSLIIAGIVLIALGAAGWRLRELTRPPPQPDEADHVASEALVHLAAEPDAVAVDLEALFPGGAWLELVDPALVLPQSHTLPYAELRALSGCEGPAPTGPTIRKAAIWRDFQCGTRASLPEDFLQLRPWMHHSGVSYAALAMRRELGLLHAAELHEPLDPARRALSELDAPALLGLHRGRAAVLAPGWILLRVGGSGRRYQAWPKARWQTLSASLPIVAERGATGCLSRAGDLCWRPRDSSAARMGWTVVVLAAAGVLLATLLFVAWRWQAARGQERAARRFIIRSLTHELRTPVTALSLSLEPLREAYDALPPTGQDAVLALSTGVARLQRTLATSAHYLELRGRDATERVRGLEIPSINDFVTNLLEGNEIELTLLPEDRALRSDPEWLALCLRNLVENALRHGRRPVTVQLKLDGTHLVIAIRDGGDSRAFDLRAMTRAFRRGDESKGLGLGLYLVSEAARALGGTLSHRPSGSSPKFAPGFRLARAALARRTAEARTPGTSRRSDEVQRRSQPSETRCGLQGAASSPTEFQLRLPGVRS